MDVVLKDASDWIEMPDAEPIIVVNTVVIIHQLRESLAAQLKSEYQTHGVQCVLINEDQPLVSGMIYLILKGQKFQCNGNRLCFNTLQLPTDLVQLILENYPQGSMTLMNDRFEIVHTTGAAYQKHQVDPSTIEGMNIREIWPPDVMQDFQASLNRINHGALWEFDADFGGSYYHTTVKSMWYAESVYYLIKGKDITDRRFAELALLESEHRNRFFLEHSREVISTHDLHGNYKLISPAIDEMLGYSSGEMIGKHPYELAHPDDQWIVAKHPFSAITSDRSESIQYRAIRKDKGVIWVDSSTIPVKNDQGQVISFTSVTRDITRLKHIEIELRQSEERFRGLADNLPGVIYLCSNDEHKRMLYLNDQVKTLTGYDKNEFLSGKVKFADLYHTDDAPNIFKTIDKALQNHEPFQVTYRLKSSQLNSLVWVEEYGRGKYEGEDLVSLEGVILDITNRVADRQKLEQSEANLKALFESTESIIGLFDTEAHLIEFNSAYSRYVLASDGVELQKGMSVRDFLARDVVDDYLADHNRALHGEKLSIPVEYDTPSGKIHFRSGLNPIIQNGKVTGVSLFAEDVTELKEHQKKLEQYTVDLEDLVRKRTKELELKNEELQLGNQQLEAAMEELQSAQDRLVKSEKMASLGVLSAGVAHEINNPLNFIKNGAEALFLRVAEYDGYDEEEMKTFADLIQGGVARMTKIIKSLSHFSREVKSMDEKFDLSSVIDNCLLILGNKIINRIKVTKNMDDNCFVKGNEGRMHQALLNLLANAEQAIEDTGEINIDLRSLGSLYELIIEDTGMGMSNEQLMKIGDPFFTTKPAGEGTGLGMFITYSIIEEHRGKIEVSSVLKKGTKVRIVMPIW